MLRATRPCPAAQCGQGGGAKGGRKRAAVGGAVLAGTVGVIGLGVGAAYADRAMRQVMSTPPQSLEAMYTAGPEKVEAGGTGLDCTVLGEQEFLHQGDVFFVCLRHMLYSSRPLYAHCKDPTWRDAGVIEVVEKRVDAENESEKMKTLGLLSVLLRLRSAPAFRARLLNYIRTQVGTPLEKGVQELETLVSKPETGGGNDTSLFAAFVAKAKNVARDASEKARDVTEKATSIVSSGIFDELVDLRHREVAMCASLVPRASANVIREKSVRLLSEFLAVGTYARKPKPEKTQLMKLARMYGALFVSPSALLKYMPPLPAQARGLPDTASRAESALLTWIGRRLSSEIDLDAAWKVRDLLLATMRVQHVGYEPEWWGWQFARCVHDYADYPDSAAARCVEVLVSELAKDPHSDKDPERTDKKRHGPQSKRASQYKGAHSAVYVAALLGDSDARKLIFALKDPGESRAELEAHAQKVVGRLGEDLFAWREYAFCADLLKHWSVDFKPPTMDNPTLASAFYLNHHAKIGELAKGAVDGTYEEVDELRRILDPAESTLVPVPKAALRMLRGFIKTGDTVGILADLAQKQADIDIKADLSAAKLISEAETRGEVDQGAYVLLRRVEELLFAMRQVELLSEQLFPRTVTWTTDEYMRRVSYGVRVRVDGVWQNYIPRKSNGTWTINDMTCVYQNGNVVKIGGTDTPVSTPSYAQWVKGVEVAKRLAEYAIDAWAPGRAARV